MTITNGYATLDDFKLRYYDGDVDDHEDDAIIENAIESVSRMIDNICGRRFYVVSETRYYSPECVDWLSVDDFIAISVLQTDRDADRTYELTWDTGDYDMVPFNAAADTAESEPYTVIEITPLGDYTFPLSRKSVLLTASFGYASSVPKPIKEACLLGAHRVMKRHDTPLGISAAPNLAQVQVRVEQLRTDPDFMAMIMPYVRHT